MKVIEKNACPSRNDEKNFNCCFWKRKHISLKSKSKYKRFKLLKWENQNNNRHKKGDYYRKRFIFGS